MECGARTVVPFKPLRKNFTKWGKKVLQYYLECKNCQSTFKILSDMCIVIFGQKSNLNNDFELEVGGQTNMIFVLPTLCSYLWSMRWPSPQPCLH